MIAFAQNKKQSPLSKPNLYKLYKISSKCKNLAISKMAKNFISGIYPNHLQVDERCK